jgi:hypothetical protein
MLPMMLRIAIMLIGPLLRTLTHPAMGATRQWSRMVRRRSQMKVRAQLPDLSRRLVPPASATKT